jgi:short-subunit dehydrogenase
MASVKGKTALITGGAGGIGFHTAKAFLAEGASVILTDVREDALQDAQRKLDASTRGPGSVSVYVNDVTDHGQVEALFRETGPVDILVNNAGIGFSSEFRNTRMEDLKRLVDINIWGTMNFVKVFLPAMIERRSGHIVNISSGQAFFPVPTWGVYAATKYFVAGFSEALHYEVGRFGVKVTTVFPYVVGTGFYSDIATPTPGTQWMIKLLPLYSTTPEKTGRIIVRAVKKGKKNEMHHPFNALNYYLGRLFPHVMEATGRTVAWALTKEA